MLGIEAIDGVMDPAPKRAGNALDTGLMQPLPMPQTSEIGLREPHQQMRGLGIVAAAEHLAMLVDPGKRLAVGERHIEPYRARTILQAVIDQTEQPIAPLPGRCR